MLKIYHNSRCGKSREAIEFLTQKGLEFEIVEYLKYPLTVMELQELIKLLHIKPIDLIRIKEKIWQENFKNKDFSYIELINIIVENPILIERPIVVNGEKAIIARPQELINNIL
jgi:arsenate reductase